MIIRDNVGDVIATAIYPCRNAALAELTEMMSVLRGVGPAKVLCLSDFSVESHNQSIIWQLSKHGMDFSIEGSYKTHLEGCQCTIF